MNDANKFFEQLFLNASELAIQGNWTLACSTLQEILAHDKSHELDPEFKLKITTHLADCYIQLELFDDARKVLENPITYHLSKTIANNSLKVSYLLVYGHTLSEFLGLEAADKNFEEALNLAESSDNAHQIESVLESMLYVGRSFQNWNYLLERATLAMEIASEKNLLELEAQANEFRAEAYSHLGRTEEAISMAKKILAFNREAKNVDEYSKWTQFITEQKSKLSKETTVTESTEKFASEIGNIAIDELPQAGSSSTEETNRNLEKDSKVIDLPDAASSEAVLDSDYLFELAPNKPSEPIFSQTSNIEVENSKKKKITIAKLIPIPYISGLIKEPEPDLEFKTLASYILESYYYEIYKKGAVSETEKKSLHRLFKILHLDRDDATMALKKALELINSNDKGQADLDNFFVKIQKRVIQSLPDSTATDLIQKIAQSINYSKI